MGIIWKVMMWAIFTVGCVAIVSWVYSVVILDYNYAPTTERMQGFPRDVDNRDIIDSWRQQSNTHGSDGGKK